MVANSHWSSVSNAPGHLEMLFPTATSVLESSTVSVPNGFSTSCLLLVHFLLVEVSFIIYSYGGGVPGGLE